MRRRPPPHTARSAGGRIWQRWPHPEVSSKAATENAREQTSGTSVPVSLGQEAVGTDHDRFEGIRLMAKPVGKSTLVASTGDQDENSQTIDPISTTSTHSHSDEVQRAGSSVWRLAHETFKWWVAYINVLICTSIFHHFAVYDSKLCFVRPLTRRSMASCSACIRVDRAWSWE